MAVLGGPPEVIDISDGGELPIAGKHGLREDLQVVETRLAWFGYRVITKETTLFQ